MLLLLKMVVACMVRMVGSSRSDIVGRVPGHLALLGRRQILWLIHGCWGTRRCLGRKLMLLVRMRVGGEV